LDEIEVARRFFVRVTQSFGKNNGSQTSWSRTTSRTQSTALTTAAKIKRFAACAERLRGCSIECRPAHEVVDELAGEETWVYVDPPYPAMVRRGNTRPNPKDYRTEMPSAEEHEQLAEALAATSAKVLVSGYGCELYDRLFAGWRRLEFEVKVHSTHARGSGREGRTEVLWMNYKPERGRLF